MFAAVDLPLRNELINVTIAYALLGAMAATLAWVAMSFVGTPQPGVARQRRKLSAVLAAQMAITAAAFFSGWAQLSPRAAQEAIERPLRVENQTLTEKLATSEETAKSLVTEKEALVHSLAESEKHVAQLTAAKEQVQARVQQVQSQLTLAQNELGEARTRIMKNTAEIEDLKLGITRTQEQIELKDALLAEQDEAIKASVARAQEVEEAYREAKFTLSFYEKRRNVMQAEGRILAVDPGWNFVVLNIGDREGVKAGSPLLVTRQGQLIARVQAKSVEPSQTVADIHGASLAKGEKIKPGDTVIFAKAAVRK